MEPKSKHEDRLVSHRTLYYPERESELLSWFSEANLPNQQEDFEKAYFERIAFGKTGSSHSNRHQLEEPKCAQKIS